MIDDADDKAVYETISWYIPHIETEVPLGSRHAVTVVERGGGGIAHQMRGMEMMVHRMSAWVRVDDMYAATVILAKPQHYSLQLCHALLRDKTRLGRHPGAAAIPRSSNKPMSESAVYRANERFSMR
jgi:hypothetical protein